MPSKPVLSEDDKRAVRERLRGLCEECWIAQEYKRTSIKNLCGQAAISIGTFYTLYPSKEDLFFETIETIQARLAEKVLVDSFAFFEQAVQAANLTLKMERSQAYGILSALLSTAGAKETLSAACDYFAVFDCMTDTLVSSIFQ